MIKKFVQDPNWHAATGALDVLIGSFNHQDCALIGGLGDAGIGSVSEEVGEFFW